MTTTTVMIMSVMMIMMTITRMTKKMRMTIMMMVMIIIIHLPLVQRHGQSPNKHITNFREHIPKWQEVSNVSYKERRTNIWGRERTKVICVISRP